MALCPECGGRVTALQLLKLRPAEAIRCRWCNSDLSVSRVVRIAVDVVLVALGAASVSWFGAHFYDTGDTIQLLLLAACGVGLFALLLIVGSFARLETRRPRDFRDWAAGEKDPALALEGSEDEG